MGAITFLLVVIIVLIYPPRRGERPTSALFRPGPENGTGESRTAAR
jgi:hypothetical protein